MFKVPGTIKSRSQKIYFNPISDNTLRKWFEQSEIINKKNLDILINLSIGRFLINYSNKYNPKYLRINKKKKYR